MSISTIDQIFVEDMPSLDDEIGCQSRFGCNSKADMRYVRACCPAWNEHAMYKASPFVCAFHYASFIGRNPGVFRCQYCGLFSEITDFAVYRLLL